MKNIIKHFGIIALVTLIGFSIIGCDDPKSKQDQSINFQIGAKEQLHTRSEMDNAGLNYWPDGSMGVIKHSDTSYSFYTAGSGGKVILTQGSLTKLFQESVQTIPISNPKASFQYMSGGPIYKLDENTLLLFYHAEQWPDGTAYTRFYSRIGLAVSKTKNADGQFIDFSDLGVILQTNRPFSNSVNEGECVDILGGQFVAYNGYLYVYFRDYNNNENDFWDMNQLAVARASLADITTAVNANSAPVFKKYFNGGWNEAGIGGKSSKLESSNRDTAWIDVSYNTHLNKFLLAVAEYKYNPDWSIKTVDLYFAFSDDGINWSDRILVSDEAVELFYPTIIGTGDEPRITGKDFYLYYTHSVTGTWNRWNDLNLIRRKITFD